MIGSYDVSYITKWDTSQVVSDLKKGQTGIVTTSFKLLPSNLVDHVCYTACTVEVVSYESCSSLIDSF